MDYMLRALYIPRPPVPMTHSRRLALLERELQAAQELFNRHPCRSYYEAVNRYTRMLARYNRLGYVRDWERKS